jgi:hypothetical protein
MRRDRVPQAAVPRPVGEATSHSSAPSDATAERAARHLNTAAAILAASVLTDSAAEHYRAGFHNGVMFIAPVVAAAVLATSTKHALTQSRPGHIRTAVLGAATITGLVGFGFHLANISRRTGGWHSTNVFFGAPIAAPLGVTTAGLLAIAGDRLSLRPTTPRLPVLVGAFAGLGLIGTAAEAGALHFRGAFQNPFMYAPVVAPPAAAAALAVAMVTRCSRMHGAARALLRLTSAIGMLGVGFHTWGVHRRMLGWRNWRQNLFAGPPLPAPPAFSGLALAALAALELLESDHQ